MQSITLSVDGRTALITLSRPERRNALDGVMIRELADALSAANRDPACRVAVITGEGAAFCAGMDLAWLREIAEKGQEENLEDARNLVKLLRLIAAHRKPVVAMVNGPALGGGLGIAAACDFVFAASSAARFGAPEVRIGFLPAVILPFLIRRMGEGAAREFVLRGDILPAGAALARGLVTETVPDADLRPSVLAFAAKLASETSPSSLTLTKDLFARIHEMSEHDAIEYAANLNALARKTDDFRKGLASFLGKERLEW